MILNPYIRVCRLASVFGAVLLGSASCITVDESLGENFIPKDQIWNVYPCPEQVLEDITLKQSDCLSGYSTRRFTFGSIKDDDFTSDNSTCFTLVPLADTLDFGEDWQVQQFHFTAVRDTLSTLYDYEENILQNVYVYQMKETLDSTVLYTNAFANAETFDKYVDRSETITKGIPVYNGGDSLSFDFSNEYAESVINGIKAWQNLPKDKRDSLKYYLAEVPGIYMDTDKATGKGGRINMFDLPIKASDGYIEGNYAELKIRAKYNGRQTDTLFVFYFGPSEFLADDATQYPKQYAFNSSISTANTDGFIADWQNGTKEKLYVEGGSGVKPVVPAANIKTIIESLIETEAPGVDKNEVVINKATIMLPYNVGTDFGKLDRYPLILSPTVKLTSEDGKYISYAGLTDSSIESENQGNINRSLYMYSPDVSHHVQEILKLEKGKGENVDKAETDDQFKARVAKYDIWFLIMHEEITETSSTNNAYNDYYNNLLYNSYYNNMMYDPYGYGYGYGGYGGYGYGGYGYGGYGGYGYNNYYNYLMMAQYASASSGTTTSSSIELDKDRFYNAVLNGPGAGGDISQKPRLKITFSAPQSAE